MWPMLIMAGVNAVSNQGKEQKDRDLAAATQRYSPWTGLQAQPVKRANFAGDLAQGYGSYMGQKQNDEAFTSNQALKQAQIGALNRSQNPYVFSNATPMAGMNSMNAGVPYSDYDPGNYARLHYMGSQY